MDEQPSMKVMKGAVPNRQVFAAVSRLRKHGFTVTHKANPNGNDVVWSINGGECLDSAQVWAFLNDVLHPATASHRDLSPARRQALGISDGLVRISVGIENVNDIIADIEQALGKAHVEKALETALGLRQD
jgi:hypothetical protein